MKGRETKRINARQRERERESRTYVEGGRMFS